MTTSRSSTRSAVLSWLVLAALVLAAGVAQAGRKRVVVLDFQGPKAEKFHADIIKLLKKHHTVVPTDKWNGTADELNATGGSGKDLKKVAHKLHIDGIIEGKIEKRRSEYIIRLELRAGTSGELVGDRIDTHSGAAKLDHTATRDIRDELVAAIDQLEVNHGRSSEGDDDEVADSHARHHGDDDAGDSGDSRDSGDSDDGGSSKHHAFSKHAEVGGDRVGDRDRDRDDGGRDDGDDSHGRKSHHGDDDSARSDDDSHGHKRHHGDDDTADASSHDDDDHGRKHEHASDGDSGDSGDSDSGDSGDDGDDGHKHHKRVAHADDGDDDNTSAEASSGGTVTGVEALTPAHRAIDATVGLSFIARRLTFAYSSQLAGSQIPSGYKQSTPVAGAYVDATVYPLAIAHRDPKNLLSGLGIEFVYDRVLRISSQKAYPDMANPGKNLVATLATVSERYAIGPVFRYPVGKLALGGRLQYESQSFLIQQSLPNGMVGPVTGADIPDVQYSMAVIGAFARYPLNAKLSLDADLSFLAVFNTGTATYDIGSSKYYGKATTSGEEVVGGADYALTKSIFLRGELRLETIGMAFKNDPGTLANNRDTDPMSQDVKSARDTYFGGMVVAGYTY